MISRLGNGSLSGLSIVVPAGAPLVIEGVATVSGVLNIGLTQEPKDGQSIQIIQSGSIDGAFTSVVVEKRYANASTEHVLWV